MNPAPGLLLLRPWDHKSLEFGVSPRLLASSLALSFTAGGSRSKRSGAAALQLAAEAERQAELALLVQLIFWPLEHRIPKETSPAVCVCECV